MSTEDVLPGNPVSIMGRRVKGGRPSNGEILQFNSTTGLWENIALPPGTPHDLLDGVVDQDTVASPVVKGGIIFGNATPKWDQLPRAAADGAIIYQNAQLPAWLAAAANGSLLNLAAGLPAWLAPGANGHILNITAGVPAWLNLTAAGYVKGGNPLTLQTGIPLADLLNAGGAAGDIIYWDGANWVRLAIGAAGKQLKVSGGLPSWGDGGVTVSNVILNSYVSAGLLSTITRYTLFGVDMAGLYNAAAIGIPITKAGTVKRVRARIQTALTGGNTVWHCWNVTTGASLGSITAGTGATGLFDSGNITNAFSAGDQIGVKFDASATTGGNFQGSIQVEMEFTT